MVSTDANDPIVDRGRSAHRGADGRRDLHRLGHSGLPGWAHIL